MKKRNTAWASAVCLFAIGLIWTFLAQLFYSLTAKSVVLSWSVNRHAILLGGVPLLLAVSTGRFVYKQKSQSPWRELCAAALFATVFVFVGQQWAFGNDHLADMRTPDSPRLQLLSQVVALVFRAGIGLTACLVTAFLTGGACWVLHREFRWKLILFGGALSFLASEIASNSAAALLVYPWFPSALPEVMIHGAWVGALSSQAGLALRSVVPRAT
jgi:hypothetical protein